MKTALKHLALMLGLAAAFTACKGDVNTDLKGQTFSCHDYSIDYYESFTFKNNGNVYNEHSICGISNNTKGCSLYYTLDNKTLKIYHGSKGWKKEVRNTLYRSGEYFEDYLVINGYIFKRE